MILSYVDLHYCNIFFFNDTATTEIYTLSLHDALPISPRASGGPRRGGRGRTRTTRAPLPGATPTRRDRKSTRLNSSHANISYAVFCLKKKTHSTIVPTDLIKENQ